MTRIQATTISHHPPLSLTRRVLMEIAKGEQSLETGLEAAVGVAAELVHKSYRKGAKNGQLVLDSQLLGYFHDTAAPGRLGLVGVAVESRGVVIQVESRGKGR